MAGHLIELFDRRDTTVLAAELSLLVHAPQSPPSRLPRYGDVLAWLVAAITDVIVARMGRPDDGEAFTIEVRTTNGHHLRVDELPASGSRVLRAVSALLAGDHAAARAQVEAADREPSTTARAENLVEALVWINVLLDTHQSTFPDRPPE